MVSTRLSRWLDERLGIDRLRAFGRHKTVPAHRHTLWYYFGGLTLLMLMVQMVTGVLLLMYYRPGAQAYASIQQMIQDVPSGRWIRSLHAVSANGMILCLMVHMFSAFFMAAYRRPRELTWLSGMGLLALALALGFSGYLLPMDERGYFATQIGVHLVGGVPLIGQWIVDVLLGGAEMSEATIARFFAMHTVALPMMMVLLLGLHLWLVQLHGLSPLAGESSGSPNERPSTPFWPGFAQREWLCWLIAFNMVALVAAIYPCGLGAQADPLKPTPLGIHPEWYFMSAFQVLRLLGRWLPGVHSDLVGMIGFGTVLLVWTFVPFIDGRPDRPVRGRVIRWFGASLLGFQIVLTIWGYMSALAQAR